MFRRLVGNVDIDALSLHFLQAHTVLRFFLSAESRSSDGHGFLFPPKRTAKIPKMAKIKSAQSVANPHSRHSSPFSVASVRIAPPVGGFGDASHGRTARLYCCRCRGVEAPNF